MDEIEIKTLIDITKTDVIRPNQGTAFDLNQQRNFITLMQCVELRSIITYDRGPVIEEVDIKSMGFGSKFKGKHRVWTFRFRPDRSGVYSDSFGHPVGALINDLDQVPLIQNLSESINIEKFVFECHDPQHRNTIVELVKQ